MMELDVSLNSDSKTAKFIFSTLIFIAILGAALIAYSTAVSEENESTPSFGIPTITGLDFDKVAVVVISQPNLTSRLRNKAIQQLTQAGLYKTNRSGPDPEHPMSLIITLDVSPVDNVPDKVIYDQKIEFEEEVSPRRDPKIHFPAVTWFYGIKTPYLTSKVTIEQLEGDLDQLLKEFIRSYGFGNPEKK
jgi:hypothetical protein